VIPHQTVTYLLVYCGCQQYLRCYRPKDTFVNNQYICGTFCSSCYWFHYSWAQKHVCWMRCEKQFVSCKISTRDFFVFVHNCQTVISTSLFIDLEISTSLHLYGCLYAKLSSLNNEKMAPFETAEAISAAELANRIANIELISKYTVVKYLKPTPFQPSNSRLPSGWLARRKRAVYFSERAWLRDEAQRDPTTYDIRDTFRETQTWRFYLTTSWTFKWHLTDGFM